MVLKILLSLLGLTSSDKMLIDFLNQNGISIQQELILPEGEFNAYIERPKEGYSLIFTEESSFLGSENQVIEKEKLYLSGIFIHAEGKDGYSQFSEEIPLHLTFDLKRKDLIEILGESSWKRRDENKNVRADRWDELNDFSLHITYSKTTNCPSIMFFSKKQDKT